MSNYNIQGGFHKLAEEISRSGASLTPTTIYIEMPDKVFDVLQYELMFDAVYRNMKEPNISKTIRLHFHNVDFCITRAKVAVKVADYLQPDPFSMMVSGKCSRWVSKTYLVGQQPEGSVMVPGSERSQD